MLPLVPVSEQQHHDVRQHAGLGHGQHDDMELENMLPLQQMFNLERDDDMLEDGDAQPRGHHSGSGGALEPYASTTPLPCEKPKHCSRGWASPSSNISSFRSKLIWRGNFFSNSISSCCPCPRPTWCESTLLEDIVRGPLRAFQHFRRKFKRFEFFGRSEAEKRISRKNGEHALDYVC